MMKKTNRKETLKIWLGALLMPFAVVAEAVSTGCKKLRTLPKKVMAVCLAAAIVMAMVPVAVFAAETTYDLWVGGVQVTSANKDDIVKAINDAANATVATGTATYDPATNTLTLNNFSYTGEGKVTQYYNAAISTNSINLHVNLLGTNTITCQSNDESVKCRAISVMEDQYGSGYLTVSGTDKETDKLICTANDGIYLRSSLTVEDATVQTNGALIRSQFGNVTITDSIVSANVKAGSNLTVENSKLESFTTLGAEDSFTITNSTVTGGGLNASDDASKITVTGSQVNVTAIDAYDIAIEGNSNVTAQAICVYQGLNVKDSSVHVTGGKIPGLQLDGNFGILSYITKAKVRIDNSTIEVYGGSGAYLYVNYNQTTFESIVPLFVDGEEFVSADNYTVYAGENAGSATEADASAAATYENKYVRITKSTPACEVTVNYGIDGVDNKEIAVTKGDTISLENPVIDGYIFMGWYANADYTTAFDFDTPITAATTVYAKFADYEDDKKTLQAAIDALEADVTQLNKLTENGGAIDQINAKISAIESQIAALKNKYAEADTALKQELQAADAVINAAIAALTVRVQDLEADLAAAKSDISTNASKVAQLTADLAALNTSLTTLSNKLTNEYATKAELTSAINSAKDTINSAIDALTVRVQDLEAGLAAANSKIDTNTSNIGTLKRDVAVLKNWKTEAENIINGLKTLTETQGTDITRLKVAVQDLEADLAAANAKIKDLEGRIEALEGKVSTLEKAQQELDAAVAALNAAIADKADTATLNEKIGKLNTAISDAEAAAKAYADDKDTAVKNALTDAIATAKGEAITAAENLVNTAKAELQNAIDSKADIVTLNTKVSELNDAIETAEATAKAYTDSAVTTLTAAIATAKGEAVNAAKDLVDAAKAELQAAIDNKADTATVNAAIANLQNAITALENAKDNYIAADAALKAELEDAIAKAKQEAIDAAKGHIPYIGTNGNWWIGDTDTGVDANGIKGDKGDKGDTGADGVGIAKIEKTATNGNVDTYTVTLTNGKTYTFTVTNGKDGTDGKDGENGKDGLTPFIGENGNWWIGDTDTGVKAVAEQTAQKGTDTITVVSIVVASVALLSNLALVIWIVSKKKKVLV